MADVKWIKITTDIFDDEKILLIESLPDSYAIITVWFKLLCLAGKQNNNGVFMMGRIAYTDKMLATIFRMKESTVTMALQTFEQFGMVEIVDGVITIPNWEKHQNLDKMQQAREQTRLRVAKHREKQKQLASCNAPCNADVTPTDKDLDKDIDLDKDKSLYCGTSAEAPPKKTTTFKPPTVEEVRAYCQERNNSIDPETFVDFYSAKGWMLGKNKMKDWKAAVRTWEKKEAENPKRRKEPVPGWMNKPRTPDEDEIAAVKRMMAGDDLQDRAEKLRQSLQGD